LRNKAEQRTRLWLEEAVIGLNLCPFARSVFAAGQVHIAVEATTSFDKAVLATLVEVERLLDAAPDDIATTLVVFTQALADFDEFLEAVDVVEALLDEAGADGILQLAHFHPDYQFEGTEPDALENFTNRAPYPTLHLLREAQVAEAVDSHPAPESIPRDNIARLQKMGRQQLEEMWERWRD
jgi:uncharacterized protein